MLLGGNVMVRYGAGLELIALKSFLSGDISAQTEGDGRLHKAAEHQLSDGLTGACGFSEPLPAFSHSILERSRLSEQPGSEIV
jgi:hypothetical protein